ncbi:methyltransferase-like protein 6-like protein [Syncephalis fuscata]|nr:methyltransferase-like protein 6-like protein [Syncephalis fuscata]
MDEALVERAKDILSQDTQVVSEFWTKKYKNEAARNWDLFYKRNTTNFFKDRHWIDREFYELSTPSIDDQGHPRRKLVLEVGCGVGNFVFPTMQAHPTHRFFACDFSKRAIDFVKSSPEYDTDRCYAFVCDLTQDPLNELIPVIWKHCPKMAQALDNIASIMRPGGVVIFRDYGLYDQAQLRFKPGHKLEESLYVRQDGTMAYYFSVEEIRTLFDKAGFDVIEDDHPLDEDTIMTATDPSNNTDNSNTNSNTNTSLAYVKRETVNRRREIAMHRIFVQGRFKRRSPQDNPDINSVTLGVHQLTV